MNRRRVAIREVMIAIALIAANVAAFRWLTTILPPAIGIPGLVVLIPLNLLLIGLARIGYRLARTGSCEPFSVGLQLLGWPATLALGAGSFANLMGYGGEWLRRYFDVVGAPMRYVLKVTGVGAWAAARPGSWADLLDVVFFLVVLGVPLLVLCLLGGLAFRTLARELARRRSSPGTAH
mgnify:CR=1 FL=1